MPVIKKKGGSSDSSATALQAYFDARTGDYWQSDYLPDHPSKLRTNVNYPTADHPKLLVKQAELIASQAANPNPIPRIIINPVLGGGGVETFTILFTADYNRPTNDPDAIGVHVDDTTAVNGLSATLARRFRTNTAATGGAHRYSNGGTASSSGVVMSSTDAETSPNHRGVYQGLWGDITV